MLYMILGHEAADGSRRRPQYREAHLAHVRPLLAEGRLVIAGPRPRVDAEEPGEAGYRGSLIIAEFEDLAAAEAWAAADPYLTGGVFERVEVCPFVQSLP